MWCWRQKEKISWIDCEKNEVLHTVKEERHILPTIKGLKAYWIGHTLCRNCLVKHGIEGQIEGRVEVRGRRGRRHRQLLDDPKEMRGYYKLKKESLNCTVWKRLWTWCKTECGMHGTCSGTKIIAEYI